MLNYLSLLNLSYFTHQFISFLCIFIFIFVAVIFLYIVFNKSLNTYFPSNFLLEYFWTFFPVVIVLFLFIPLFFYFDNLSDNFSLIYFFIGNQWFWDFFSLESYTLGLSYDFNLYSSCPIVYLPYLMYLKFYFTSNDVLHAFSLPILYTMIDLVPGNIHSLFLFFPYLGIYTVYCAQICGLNHSVMPFYIYTIDV